MNIGKILKKDFIQKIDIDRYAFYQAIRTLIAGLVAIYVGNYFPSLQNYWIILTAVLLVQSRVGYLIQEHVAYQLVAGLLAAALVFAASYLGSVIVWLAVFLSLTSLVSVYLGFRYRNLFLTAYLVNLLAMISGGVPVDFEQTWQRSEFVLYGTVISLAITIICWPSILRLQIKAMMRTCLKINLQLLRIIFDIYLKKDYAANHFFYEKKIYYLSRLFAYWMRALWNLGQRSNGVFSDKVARIDRIFSIATGLGALRYRISDHSTFGMINLELSDIWPAMAEKFKAAANGKHVPADDRVQKNIDRLDEVYQGALQVAAQEPIVYLFFIQGLQAIDEELNKVMG